MMISKNMIEYNEETHIAILRKIIKVPVHQNLDRCPARMHFLMQGRLPSGWIKKDSCSFCKQFHEVSKDDTLCPCEIMGKFEARLLTLRKLHLLGYIDRQTMTDGIKNTLYHKSKLDGQKI